MALPIRFEHESVDHFQPDVEWISKQSQAWKFLLSSAEEPSDEMQEFLLWHLLAEAVPALELLELILAEPRHYKPMELVPRQDLEMIMKSIH